MKNREQLVVREATRDDVPLLLEFIRALADYEKLSNDVIATEALVENHLFGPDPKAKALFGYAGTEPVCFAVYFYNFSTFLGRPGLYLEDLFVKPSRRGRGYGKAMLRHLAKTARDNDCGRFEWAVLDWNEPAIQFYRGLGAIPMSDWTIFRVDGHALNGLAGSD